MRGGFWRHFDFWLLGAVTILVIIGVTMIRSAVAGNIELTTTTNLVNRQMIFAAAGFVVMLLTASIDYRMWASISQTLYVGTFIVLGALNIAGQALYGSARWFDTGVILIQPSEIAKIVMILVMSNYFAVHLNQMHEPRWTFRSFFLMMGITGWVLAQPNLSTSIVLFVLWGVLLWIAGLPLKMVFGYGLAGLLAVVISFPVLVEVGVIQEYQLRRIINFIAPDPNATYGDLYNIQQALISIGSGGLFGQGYGHGTQVQLRFLKVRWSDFIFSTIAHELGFVGAVLVIGLVVFVVWRCLYAARVARDPYGALISYGVATLIAFQALVNIGVNLNVMPATGLTLPFVSYGGSSLLANMIAIGLVQSVIMRHKALEI
ncbi:MAG: putative lipid II flippase FtsW [Anaerolineales bacterium]|nr:putative lipid II flippase FtsW [Anaerolineales bacterium]MCX7754898.1 putative lipid II flippase FtsW [Anaerolineales bacterium]MDW8278983.1 FtsW/RodA/SpoVE family cell cycle protein [Anaerolineales bacterium]